MNEVLLDLLNRTLSEYSKRKGISLPESFDYELVVTKDPAHGNFASNIAFKLARYVREKPNLVADELVLLLENEIQRKEKTKVIDRLEVAGGGFINFYMTKTALARIILEVHRKGKHYGESNYGCGRKVLLEFVSANPTGPLTIAHGRQAAVGDALARILKTTGHMVTTEYYLNDAGRQMHLLGESLWARYGELLGQPSAVPADGYQGSYLVEIAQKLLAVKSDTLLKEKREDAIRFCSQFAADEIMKGIREDLTAIRVTFDHYFSEDSLYKTNAVEQGLHFLKDRDFLYEKDGAVWFRSSAFGDDKDRVVKKSSGEYTYLAPDIAYHRHKFERGYNWLINLWGPDHHGYVTRLKAGCQALGHSAEEIDIRIVQLTTLYRQGQPVRMSTRAGEFVTLRELFKEVGVDAARCFFVMRRVESHLDFDLELAKQKSEENPVYYLQYGHARIASLLRFADQPVTDKVNPELLQSQEEISLMKLISEYPDVLIQASKTLEPYVVSDYLKELASCFHRFYQFHRVVTENKDLTGARLLLVDAVRIVLRNGLEVLGISQPDSM
ncbi:MAG: arginine--tRNA ligase [Candidatus Omnitrophica bacterium]|nr:arginine--tRNA ligase [Candidatus Omnitrophota bacterium]